MDSIGNIDFDTIIETAREDSPRNPYNNGTLAK